MGKQNRRLTQRQQKFVEAYLTGIPASEAAKQAGYSPSKAHRGASLLELPAVAEMVKDVREKACEQSVYNLSQAMQESLEVIEFSKENKNSMAYFKAVEHRAKLSGLLTDRVDVRVATVNIRTALDEARSRVQNWDAPALSPPVDVFK